jgi:hypothetical protein
MDGATAQKAVEAIYDAPPKVVAAAKKVTGD